MNIVTTEDDIKKYRSIMEQEGSSDGEKRRARYMLKELGIGDSDHADSFSRVSDR